MVARVALDLILRREFDYFIPPQLEGQVLVGSRVKVPFGSRLILGSVTTLLPQSEHPNLKSINKVIGEHAHIPPKVFELARWISDYYCCPLDATLRSVLPEAVRQEEPGWKEQLVVTFVNEPTDAHELSVRMREILALLREKKSARLALFLKEAKTTSATLRKLEEAHLVRIAPEISERDPYANEVILPTQPLELNPEQKAAFEKIAASMEAKKSTSFLLHGVTGSGKTEIYLQAIARALERGQGAIVLVPEISLTPQTVERFKARFSSGPLQTLVAVLHSHLSAGERHDEWQKIRQNRARIVIGARSAIFAPVEKLGLIIVDEEHEHSYKQEESPRYHARDCAVMRGQLEGAVVVLGSATPSMESFFNAQSGKYTLLEMPTRVDDQKLPLVRVVDMRLEARHDKGQGVPIFSRVLRERILQRLEKGEQTILFLNRRGYASSLQCPKCGYVAGCPNCSVSLTYHRHNQKLICHICGHNSAAPTVCPEAKCRNPAIRYAGIGTERVEEALPKLFPKARIARMDSDALKRKDDFKRILGDFRTGKIDILLGTQMIAKGLHFPNVTLVGIIYADLTLHMPDFRAGERTFQLLTQVSGRAGRGDIEGEVVVQAFTPFHPAIQYARRHDYLGFYDQEIEFRQQLSYPPHGRVAMLTMRGRNEEKVSLCADHVRKELDATLGSAGQFIVAGPAPAPLLKAENFFRYQIMLRGRQMPKLSRYLQGFTERVKMPEDVLMTIDIDPVNLV